MLNHSEIKAQLKQAFDDILLPAIFETIKATLPYDSEEGTKMAENASQIGVDGISDDLAERIAGIIEYAFGCAEIEGLLITKGTEVTQTVVVSPISSRLVNGTTGNTLHLV